MKEDHSLGGKVVENKPGEVSALTDVIQMEIDRLEDNFGMLYNQLSNIMPDEEDSVATEPDSPPARTNLGRKQADQARRLHTLNILMERLRNRVEN